MRFYGGGIEKTFWWVNCNKYVPITKALLQCCVSKHWPAKDIASFLSDCIQISSALWVSGFQSSAQPATHSQGVLATHNWGNEDLNCFSLQSWWNWFSGCEKCSAEPLAKGMCDGGLGVCKGVDRTANCQGVWKRPLSVGVDRMASCWLFC